MTKFKIVITKDGKCLIPRGTPKQNETMLRLIKKLNPHEDVTRFFQESQNNKLIFGSEVLCG